LEEGVYIVFGARGAEASNPLNPSAAISSGDFDFLLEHDGIQLVAHFTGLGLAFNFVTVDGAVAIRKWTEPGAVLYCPGTLVCGALDDLKADFALPIGCLRDQADTGTLAR